jgi:DNA polymerase-3 subunit beta
MKVSCLQENLSRGLAIVGRAVANRATLPITQNVLLSTHKSMLKLSATNLEIAMTTWVGGEVVEEGAITVPARLLSELVSSLPRKEIKLELQPGTDVLRLTCDKSEANIHGADASEFPPIPTVDGGISAQIKPLVLKDAIARVAFAAATEESRPVLTGVEVKLEGEQFSMAAADGFRLAVQHGPLMQAVESEIKVIVPARTLNELSRLLGDQEEPVEIMMTPAKGQVLFRTKVSESVEIVSQLLQGSFPNYEQLIPQSYKTRAVFDLEPLLRAARTASIFARDGSNIIRLQVIPAQDGETAGKLIISARSEEVGDHQDEVDADEIEGDEGKIAFNSRYLLDVLSVLERGKITLETTASSSPGVFRPTGAEDYVHVVMPMFVQW